MGTELVLTIERIDKTGIWHGIYTSPMLPYIPHCPLHDLALENPDYQLMGLLSTVRSNPKWGPLLTPGYPNTPSPLLNAIKEIQTLFNSWHSPGWIAYPDITPKIHAPNQTPLAQNLHDTLTGWLDTLDKALAYLATQEWMATLPIKGPVFKIGSTIPFSDKGTGHERMAFPSQFDPFTPDQIRLHICYTN